MIAKTEEPAWSLWMDRKKICHIHGYRPTFSWTRGRITLRPLNDSARLIDEVLLAEIFNRPIQEIMV